MTKIQPVKGGFLDQVSLRSPLTAFCSYIVVIKTNTQNYFRTIEYKKYVLTY